MKALIAFLSVALVSAPAFADQANPDTAKAAETKPAAGKEKLSTADLQVVAHYHELNQLEINLARLAKKNGSAQGVKDYADMLIKDHGDSDKQLTVLVKARKQAIPTEKPATDAEKQEKAETKKRAAALAKLKGADFDRQYLQMMVDGHDREVAKADTMLAQAQSSEVQDMVRAKKPVLQGHADQARELQKNPAQASIKHEHK